MRGPKDESVMPFRSVDRQPTLDTHALDRFHCVVDFIQDTVIADTDSLVVLRA